MDFAGITGSVNHRYQISEFRPKTNLRHLEITEYSAETEYSATVNSWPNIR